MVRRGTIQWSKSDYDKLKREVKRYNDRLRYARKKNPEVIYPPSISAKRLREEITTTRQYKSVLGDLSKATAKTLKPDKRARIPYVKQVEQLQRKRKSGIDILSGRVSYNPRITNETVIDVKRRKVLEEMEIESAPGRFPTEQQFISRVIGLKEGDPENYAKLQDWMEKSESSLHWKDNYLKGISNSMEIAISTGDVQAYEQLKLLYEEIAGMDREDFLIGQLTKHAKVAQDYIYTTGRESDSEWAGKIERIRHEWSSIYG